MAPGSGRTTANAVSPVVFVVDDDPSFLIAVARLLRATGHSVETFSCVVLDIQLGGMSGFELQRRLAASAAAPPVVFLTAHEVPETIAGVSRTGCAYVRKTEPGRTLLDAIRRAVTGRESFPKG